MRFSCLQITHSLLEDVASDPGVVVLRPGAGGAGSSDETEEDVDGPPSPCAVRFVNDNVLINGRSSMPTRPNPHRTAKVSSPTDVPVNPFKSSVRLHNMGSSETSVGYELVYYITHRAAQVRTTSEVLKLQFDDSLTRTFEYPSETSLCEDISSNSPPPIPTATPAHTPTPAPAPALADNTRIGKTSPAPYAHRPRGAPAPRRPSASRETFICSSSAKRQHEYRSSSHLVALACLRSTVRRTNVMCLGVAASAALSSYRPSKTAPPAFQLGVTRAQSPPRTLAPAPAADIDHDHESAASRACAEDARSWSEARAAHTDLLF
ncbi:hypothetical protein EVAR_41133_1 [Eumeta japonica]|uniref:Uncharacterized protein n=1 Tax=Eumeta variegata TaxID=151549 RepID=A0A4C1YEM7_EUMVA|nr:hypothetical protein EVAR_41133_1 [Eumeta japonica]